MWSILYTVAFLLSIINAAIVTPGTRANISLYLSSSDESVDGQPLYSANQDNTVHFLYGGDESILFASTFMYDGTTNSIYDRKEGSNDRYYLTFIDDMLRTQKGSSGMKVTLNTDGSLDFDGSDHLFVYKLGDGSIKYLVLSINGEIPTNVVPVKVKAKTNWATL
ncbi:hypothetical protein Cantr_05466 [Candida viswanathii]|uniref:Cell wall protein RHD3 n=1 Tax=Candida viswanathii TaxID=5486 RepID=A0A367XR68_9ASCO|nr:hypothetical protein Cantr_05476 [Candida viswanathii]RCK56674.1 hypothetical protein Cantr_05466 [Candida viswanathii]